jgi:hypothetical protein
MFSASLSHRQSQNPSKMPDNFFLLLSRPSVSFLHQSPRFWMSFIQAVGTLFSFKFMEHVGSLRLFRYQCTIWSIR